MELGADTDAHGSRAGGGCAAPRRGGRMASYGGGERGLRRFWHGRGADPPGCRDPLALAAGEQRRRTGDTDLRTGCVGRTQSHPSDVARAAPCSQRKGRLLV